MLITHPFNQKHRNDFMHKKYADKSMLSWALYDWANSAFATTVIAGFFPIFFKEYWSSGTSATESTFQLGLINSTAGIIIALFAPVFGAIADRGSSKKKFLLFFAMMGIVMTGALYMVDKGSWICAAFIYAAAVIGFSGSNIFYDSLLVDISSPVERDFVSSLGYSMGYLGGGILFAINVAMTLHPALFGLADQPEAIRISFISVALWWALFSIPVFIFVRETGTAEKTGTIKIIKSGFTDIISTFREIQKYRIVFIFLAAYWLYIDGVDTIIRMAVDYGISLGFNTNSLITALLVTQFVGFPATLAFGVIGKRLGTKTGLYIAIAIYTGVCVWGYFINSINEFYILAIAIGLVQGGIQSLSRSLFSRIIPPEKTTEFFGFYNMIGKFAVFVGPLLMGTVAYLTGSPRLSIISIAILFIAGGIVLYFVKENETP